MQQIVALTFVFLFNSVALCSDILSNGQAVQVTTDNGRVVFKKDDRLELFDSIISAVTVKDPNPIVLDKNSEGRLILSGGMKHYVVGDKVIRYLAPCYGGNVTFGTPIFLGKDNELPKLVGQFDAHGNFSIHIPSLTEGEKYYLYFGGYFGKTPNGMSMQSGSSTIKCSINLPQQQAEQVGAHQPDVSILPIKTGSAPQKAPESQVTIGRPALSVTLVPTISHSNFSYEIQLSSSTGHMQTIRIRNGVAIRIQDMQFVDLNADGYRDMMVLGGTDAEKNKWYKTWIYNPKTKQYVWLGKAVE